jgi:hypothetical protein
VTKGHDRPAGESRPSGQGFFGRLEELLKPFVGGAQLGPAQAPPAPPRPEWVCDVCRQPAHAHRFDSSQRGRMYCPPVTSAAD